MKRASLLALALILLVAMTAFSACDKNGIDTSTDEVTTEVSEVTTTEPEVTTTEPEVTTTEPEVTTTEPEVTTTEPEVTTTEPEVTTTEPEVTTTEPEVTTTEPEVTTTEPEVTTTEPEVTTTEPEVTTTEPEVTTTKPEVTTTEPEVTTTEPEVTTTEPEVTTTEPEDTTTEPEDTTTEPEDTTTESDESSSAEPDEPQPVPPSEGLEYVSNGNGTCYVAGIGTCTDVNIVIPSRSPDGLLVTGISDSAFYWRTTLMSIVIPDSVTYIGDKAFFNCFNLKTAALGTGITSIGCRAFYGCMTLTAIPLPDGVIRIGEEAFYNCDSLTAVLISKSVTEIGDSAFADCMHLESIVVDADNSTFISKGNCLIHKELKVLLAGCNTSVIPSDGSVERIAKLAFSNCSNLASITIPPSVTHISDGAFAYCDSLTDIVIPDSVSYIGSYAFNACTALTSLTIGSGITDMGERAFEGCLSLKELTIKDGATVIGSGAFSVCAALTNVIIPNSVNKIADSAFFGCSSLKSITLPNGLMFISPSLFQDCAALTDIVLPDSVVEIGSYAFQSCSALTGIRIPNNVYYIGLSAFSNCSALTRISIPDSVITLDTSVFSGCTSLESASVGKGIAYVELATFSNCTSLKSIILSNALSGVLDEAFLNCTSLTDVYYTGNATEWAMLYKGALNTALTSATVYYYSESRPFAEGNYWHYADGILTIWTEFGPTAPIYDPQTFAGGSITTEPIVIQTNYLELYIPANVYIPDDLVENINIVTAAMEAVSGLKFEGNPLYADGLLQVEVVKLTDTECELGPAYASASGVTISSGDLTDLFALIHECSHALQYRNSNWFYCTWAMEGISTYTTLKTQMYIQEHYPHLVEMVGTVNNSYLNYGIWDYSKLYEHDMVYWMTNTFEYSGNVNYSIGFRLMCYLEETYGDYTSWITRYEASNPCANYPYDQLDVSEQILAFTTTYADSVFEDFYAWLQKNEERFNTGYEIDLREASKFNVYPVFANGNSYVYLNSSSYGMLYNDLYIGLDQMKYYLSEYKGRDISGIYLVLSPDVTVAVYDANGNLLRCVTTSYETSTDVDLTDASYIKLMGEGKLTFFQLEGYDHSVA